MPNECWRKIQQREIVITNKYDIMTCIQENNVLKIIREIQHSNQKGYVYWQIQGNSFLALAFEYAESYFSAPFFGVPSQSCSLLKVSSLNKLQHVYFKHSALWMDPIRMFGKYPYFSGIGTACRIIEGIFQIIVCILIPE